MNIIKTTKVDYFLQDGFYCVYVDGKLLKFTNLDRLKSSTDMLYKLNGKKNYINQLKSETNK